MLHGQRIHFDKYFITHIRLFWDGQDHFYVLGEEEMKEYWESLPLEEKNGLRKYWVDDSYDHDGSMRE